MSLRSKLAYGFLGASVLYSAGNYLAPTQASLESSNERIIARAKISCTYGSDGDLQEAALRVQGKHYTFFVSPQRSIVWVDSITYQDKQKWRSKQDSLDVFVTDAGERISLSEKDSSIMQFFIKTSISACLLSEPQEAAPVPVQVLPQKQQSSA